MNLLSPITTSLTEPPGNIIYHLVTLFALQAVFAISLSQWLRDRDNGEAWRGALASGGLVIGRVLLLALGLLLAYNPVQAAVYLPPLEQALNGVTAVFLVWALVLPSPNLPRLGNVLLLLSLVVISLLTFSLTFAWRPLAISGVAYVESSQVIFWLGLQVVIYGLGLSLLLFNRYTRFGLQPFIVGVLLGTAVIALIGVLAGTADATTLLFWTRLGYLVAFPLWAASAYRQSITPLLAAQQANRPATRQLADSLTLSAQLLQAYDTENRTYQAVAMIQQLLDADFVGVGIFPPDNNALINLTSNLPQTGTDAPRSWQLELVDWPPFRTAIRKKGGVELLADGQGTRHLHVLYEAMEVGPFGAMLVEPLFVAEEAVGMLLLAKGDGRLRWSAREKAIAPALAAFVAQALTNSYRQTAAAQQTPLPISTLPLESVAATGRLIALEAERDRLAAELETAVNRANQSEARAVVALRRAHDLAQTLEEMERLSRDERIAELEREITTLRESLAEAEEAMAMAAAGEIGLTTEWVMLTITRYSGQLEEAQARITALETELERREQGTADELLIALIQELRTPMTSMVGFTDLLLGETMGILGSRQRDLLTRIQANTRRMGGLLDQMLQLLVSREHPAPEQAELVDVREAIETAVTAIMPQVRDKNLRLDMDIRENLPALSLKRDDLQQMVVHLLANACQASVQNGRIILTVQANAIQRPDQAQEMLRFLQINVSDSGSGIHPDDLPHVFAAQHRADAPLIQGLGDTGAGLSVAHDLVQANGGRIWVDSTIGRGSTFSLLFPLVGEIETAVPPANGAVRP
jgi:signal transduction histidine kinase